MSAALTVFVTAGDDKPKKSNSAVRQGDKRFIMDDFESGVLNDWQAAGAGAGGWFVYTNGHKSPDPTRSDPNVPFDLPDPPQGKFAALTETNGPGTRILYRDVKLDGRFRLRVSVFYDVPAGRGRYAGRCSGSHRGTRSAPGGSATAGRWNR